MAEQTSMKTTAGRREWLGLDMTVLHLAAPVLTTDLAPSSSQP